VAEDFQPSPSRVVHRDHSDLAASVQITRADVVAGADDIDGMDVLRHGAIPVTFGGIRAPSTLGSFLRAFSHANVRQLQAVGRRVLGELAVRTPLLPGGEQLAFIDMDSMQKRVFGSAKQGAAFGHTKIASKSLTVRGLNVLAATVATPIAAPVIVTARLRSGNATSVRGAASLVVEAINAAREAGVTGDIVVRADSAFYAERFSGQLPPPRRVFFGHREDVTQAWPGHHRHRVAHVGVFAPAQ
jgi:hypothetical protein